jgi:hypothetical protein
MNLSPTSVAPPSSMVPDMYVTISLPICTNHFRSKLGQSVLGLLPTIPYFSSTEEPVKKGELKNEVSKELKERLKSSR